MGLGEGVENAGTGSGTGGSGSGGNTGGSGSGGNTGGSAGAGAGAGAQGGVGSGAGGTAASWRDTLPDDLKANPTLSKYSDIPNLAKAHVELQKLIGQKGIIKPGKEASPEEVKAFREALGIPTDATKYDMGAFGDGLKVPDVTVEWAKKLGAEHGVEPAAMKALIEGYFKLDAQGTAATATAKKEEIKKGFEGLRTEWGDAFDQNLTRANFAAQKLGGQPLVDALKKYGADNDPTILKAFSEAAKLYSEDRLREAGAGNGQQTPQELDAELTLVRSQLIGLSSNDGRRPGLLNRLESLSKQKTRGK